MLLKSSLSLSSSYLPISSISSSKNPQELKDVKLSSLSSTKLSFRATVRRKMVPKLFVGITLVDTLAYFYGNSSFNGTGGGVSVSRPGHYRLRPNLMYFAKVLRKNDVDVTIFSPFPESQQEIQLRKFRHSFPHHHRVVSRCNAISDYVGIMEAVCASVLTSTAAVSGVNNLTKRDFTAEKAVGFKGEKQPPEDEGGGEEDEMDVKGVSDLMPRVLFIDAAGTVAAQRFYPWQTLVIDKFDGATKHRLRGVERMMVAAFTGNTSSSPPLPSSSADAAEANGRVGLGSPFKLSSNSTSSSSHSTKTVLDSDDSTIKAKKEGEAVKGDDNKLGDNNNNGVEAKEIALSSEETKRAIDQGKTSAEQDVQDFPKRGSDTTLKVNLGINRVSSSDVISGESEDMVLVAVADIVAEIAKASRKGAAVATIREAERNIDPRYSSYLSSTPSSSFVTNQLRIEPLVEKVRVPSIGTVYYLPHENCTDIEKII